MPNFKQLCLRSEILKQAEMLQSSRKDELTLSGHEGKRGKHFLKEKQSCINSFSLLVFFLKKSCRNHTTLLSNATNIPYRT